MRKLLVLTGKRGGYGAMKPMLRLLDDDPEFALQLVVTDQHVSERFGGTASEVEKEFVIAAKVDMAQEDGSARGRARALARCAMKMTDVLQTLCPEMCLLYGDRGEVLATAMTATALGLPICHIQGGDVSGSLDDNMRHAITKLAHLHFASTEASAERIAQMGEEAWRIHVVGDSHVDAIVAGDYLAPAVVAKTLGLDLDAPVIVILQHSETTAPERSYQQMRETLLAVRDTKQRAVVVHPCSDQGYEGVVQAIEEIAKPPQFQSHLNLEAPVFWGLMNIASVMVGNSSAGLIEAPYFALPAVNVGRRQEGRQHAENVIQAGHDRSKIAVALETAMSDAQFRAKVDRCSRPFGDGTAAQRIVAVLRDTESDDRLLVKRMTY